MRRYKHEQLLVSPTPRRIQAAIRYAEAVANQGRQRGLIDASMLVRFWGPASTRQEEWAVPSYQWLEARPTPTFRTFREGVAVLGVCWWVAPNQTTHFRIVAEEVRAPDVRALKASLREWGLSDPDLFSAQHVTFVYPALWVPRIADSLEGPRWNILRALSKRPLQPDLWAMLADLFEDDGSAESAFAARGALQACLSLAPHL